MPARRIRASAIDFRGLREELDLTVDHPADALLEAERVAANPHLPAEDMRDVEFVTLDPAGSRDLDQAVHIERTSEGHVVRYAIADVAAFVEPGGALDVEARRRGQTVYFPDVRVPLYPSVLSEGGASLLPDVDRPAVVWSLAVDETGEPQAVDVRRALVRSRQQLDYVSTQKAMEAGELPDPIAELPTLGQALVERARRRGAIELRLPEQRVVLDETDEASGWDLLFRAQTPVERYNAQISLLTGEVAASMMVRASIGLLRTLPPPQADAVEHLRLAAPSLGIAWPPDAKVGDVLATLDADTAAGAAFLDLAASLLRGAGYTAFDGQPPAETGHGGVGAPYAHVTAPLRRLADRYCLETCLALCAGVAVPPWVRAALPSLPEFMARSDQKANAAERAVVDTAEALVLQPRVGESFAASVVDVDEKGAAIVIAEPAVRARCAGAGLRAGTTVTVRLTEADPVKRKVAFVAEPA